MARQNPMDDSCVSVLIKMTLVVAAVVVGLIGLLS